MLIQLVTASAGDLGRQLHGLLERQVFKQELQDALGLGIYRTRFQRGAGNQQHEFAVLVVWGRC